MSTSTADPDNKPSKAVQRGPTHGGDGSDRFGLAGDLRLLIDSVPALIHTGLPNGDLDFFNQRWLEYVGRPLSELTGWKWTASIHPDDVDGMVNRWKASLADGHDFLYEARVRRADGKYRWMLHRKVAVRDDAVKIVKWYGSSVDIEERKRAEQRARRNEREFREIVDFLPQHVLVFDPEGRLLHANQLISDYTGRTLDELKGLSAVERLGIDVHPDDMTRVHDEHRRSLSEGQPFELDWRVRNKNGVYRWFLFRYKPLLDEAGRVSRWFCTATDIEEMKSSEEELRLAVDTMSAFLHTARPDGLVDFLNRRWLDYLGLTLEAALARCDVLDIRDPAELDLSSWSFRSVIHPDDLEEITTVWRSIVETKVVEDAYARIRRFDGTYRWFLFRTCPRFDETRTLVKWYGAAIDIEDQKRAEEKLRQKEIEVANQLRQMVNTTPGLGWTARPDGSADFLNQQWLEYSGLSIEEAIGWGFLAAIHPDDMPRIMEDWQRSLRTGEFFETEGRVRRHDGEYRRFLFRGSPVRDSEGSIIKWIGIDTDVEESRRMAEALRASEARLSRATQIATVAELSASIAHEINQSLAAVITNGDACEMWLSTDPPNIERAKVAVQRIIRDGNGAAEVIQRIRALFKQAVPNKLRLDMNEVIAEVLRLVANEVERKDIRIETDLQSDLPKALADRIQMQQLMINLVHNGIESMDNVHDRLKRLILRSKCGKDSTILIEVCDHGAGIEDTERVFEPFFTTKNEGMGMGLSICRSIVDAHGGILWAARNEEYGSTFRFTIPILSETA